MSKGLALPRACRTFLVGGFRIEDYFLEAQHNKKLNRRGRRGKTGETKNKQNRSIERSAHEDVRRLISPVQKLLTTGLTWEEQAGLGEKAPSAEASAAHPSSPELNLDVLNTEEQEQLLNLLNKTRPL